jgi:hypothetical protein
MAAQISPVLMTKINAARLKELCMYTVATEPSWPRSQAEKLPLQRFWLLGVACSELKAVALVRGENNRNPCQYFIFIFIFGANERKFIAKISIFSFIKPLDFS